MQNHKYTKQGANSIEVAIYKQTLECLCYQGSFKQIYPWLN